MNTETSGSSPLLTPPPLPAPAAPADNVRLWNPNAVAWWSLFFTPAFGAYFHARNWRVLRDRPQARANFIWLFVTVVFIVFLFVVPFFSRFFFKTLMMWALFGVWYATRAQRQIQYVKDTFPSGYRKRPLYLPVGGLFLAFILLIGILFFLALRVATNNGFVQKVVVNRDMRQLQMQIWLYESRSGFRPTTEQGLQALVVKPTTDPRPSHWAQVAKSIPQDPWQHDYVYRNPGLKNPQTYELFSAGPDGHPDTDDDEWGFQEPP